MQLSGINYNLSGSKIVILKTPFDCGARACLEQTETTESKRRADQLPFHSSLQKSARSFELADFR